MRSLIIMLGIVLILVGILWPWLIKSGLGSLPGDIYIKRDNYSFYFPIVTCLIVSVIITIILWLIKK